MSDYLHHYQTGNDSEELPGRVIRLLRAPVPTTDSSKQLIMARVRRAARPRAGGWRARGGLSPLGGLTLAAAVGGLMVTGALRHPGVVLRSGGSSGEMQALHDTIGISRTVLYESATLTGKALHDTLRLVRFALLAPSATKIALVGDFNAWNPRATPLAAAGDGGMWSSVVALVPGAQRYAYLIGDSLGSVERVGAIRTLVVPAGARAR